MPLFTIAQSNYKPGYIVTTKGDTLKGYINYKEWGTNPKSITFKSTLNDKDIHNYDTENLTSFNVIGLESYKLYSGPISTDATDPNRISTGRDSSFKVDNVFLKVLFRGQKITLYVYNDSKRRFYISGNSNYAPYELIYRTYLNGDRTNEGERTIIEAGYKRQLLMLAQQYKMLNDDINTEIRQADYTDADLENVVSQIDGVSKSEYKKKQSDRAGINFYIGGGVNFTSIQAGGDYASAGGKNYNSTPFTGVIGLNVLLTPNTGRLAIRAEISATSFQYRSNYVNKISPYVLVHYSFDVLSLTFTPQIIYNVYNTPNFKIYGGIGVDFNSYKYSNKIFKSEDGSQITTLYPFYFYEYSGVPFAKAGIILNKRLEIYSKFNISSPLSNSPFFVLDITTTQIGINYFLGKTKNS